jgi:hypothetical protein
MTVVAGGMKRGRKVFFVTLHYDEDCVTTERRELVVVSRRQAKKVIHYTRARCLEFHGADILPARQHDLFYTGWTVNRRGPAGRKSQP